MKKMDPLFIKERLRMIKKAQAESKSVILYRVAKKCGLRRIYPRKRDA